MDRIPEKEGRGRLARKTVATASCRKPPLSIFPAFIPSILSIPVQFLSLIPDFSRV